METLSQWVFHYGYAGIFFLLVLGIVGLPIPDETLLTFAGYLVFRNHLKLTPVYAAAFLGSICGITISYGLGAMEVLEVKKLERRDLSEDLFSAPKDYRKISPEPARK